MTLAWRDPPRPGHRRRELRAYYNWELAEHERLKSPATAAAALPYKSVLRWSFYPIIVNAFMALESAKESSRRVVRAICAIVLAAVVFRLAATPAGVPLMGPHIQMSWCCSQYRPSYRWPYERRLQATEGRHLVVVRYGPPTGMYPEWVYNEADIDSSKIVWARDMGEAADRELIRYYPERRVWLAEPDALPPRIHPY